MSSNYKIENELQRIIKEIESTKNELEAWEKVERVSKKDGKDFKVLSMNFKNCKVDREFYAEKEELKVFVYFKGNGYSHNAIACYETIEKDDPRNNSPRAWKRGAGLKNGYLLTVDEIFEKIEAHKKYLLNRIAELENARDNYNIVVEFIDSVQKTYNSILSNNRQLGYSIADLLRAGVIY